MSSKHSVGRQSDDTAATSGLRNYQVTVFHLHLFSKVPVINRSYILNQKQSVYVLLSSKHIVWQLEVVDYRIQIGVFKQVSPFISKKLMGLAYSNIESLACAYHAPMFLCYSLPLCQCELVCSHAHFAQEETCLERWSNLPIIKKWS